MKKKLLFTMIITVISLSVSAQNLVINGDFETAIGAEWSLWNSDGAGIPNNGVGAMRMKGNQGGFSQVITVVPGNTYNFSYAGRWLTTPTLPADWFTGMSMGIINTADNTNLNTSPTLITTDTYTTVSVDLTIPAGVTEVKLDFFRPKNLPLFYADDFSVTVSAVAGINEIGALKANVYPNPASDVLNISASEELVSYKVFNVLGKKVLAGKLNSSVNVSDLSKGFYFVKTKGASGQLYTAKFIVK